MPPPPPSTRRPTLSRRKKLLFAALTLLAVFLALEIVLALAGVRPRLADDPFLGFSGHVPLFVPDPGQPDTLVTAPARRTWFNGQRFPREKPPRTRRIFCLGGSTTYGRPYDDRTSYVAWLRELLPQVDPDTNWEVVNAGGISYASYRLALLQQELLQYEPDLFVVYTGHNEFLEQRTYGHVRDLTRATGPLLPLVTRLRTFALVSRAVASPPPDRPVLPADVDAVLDRTVGPTSYERDDTQRERTRQHFAWNLARLVRTARGAGAEVLFVTPASNQADVSPFKSQHRAGLSAEERDEWQRFYDAGRQRERAADFAAAREHYRRALALDDRYAELHYRLGRVALRLERFDDAAAAFQRAVDEDVCPLRAPSGFVDAVRNAAEKYDAPLVDLDARLRAETRSAHGHSAPGSDHFLDHVHPTVDTHGRLARAILERLIEQDRLQPARPLDEAAFARVHARIDSRLDDRRRAVGLLNVAKVFAWAGKHDEALSLSRRALERLPRDPQALRFAAALARRAGRRERALDWYRRAVDLAPQDASARRALALLLLQAGRPRAATEQLRELLRHHPGDRDARRLLDRASRASP